MSDLDPTQPSTLVEAEAAHQKALQDLWIAEEQLENARRAVTLTSGLVNYYTFQPLRHQVLNPIAALSAQQLYTYCMQLGYNFAVMNGTVHYAGKPGELMVDTGLKLSDVPA